VRRDRIEGRHWVRQSSESPEHRPGRLRPDCPTACEWSADSDPCQADGLAPRCSHAFMKVERPTARCRCRRRHSVWGDLGVVASGGCDCRQQFGSASRRKRPRVAAETGDDEDAATTTRSDPARYRYGRRLCVAAAACYGSALASARAGLGTARSSSFYRAAAWLVQDVVRLGDRFGLGPSAARWSGMRRCGIRGGGAAAVRLLHGDLKGGSARSPPASAAGRTNAFGTAA
jgi:hypothetical protein